MTGKEAYDVLKVLNGVFFMARISNPITHDVLDIQEDGTIEYHEKCFDVWQHGNPCDHCSTKRTCEEHIITDKYEPLGDDVFHVVSKPVEVDGISCAFEIVTKLDDTEDIKRREVLLQTQEMNVNIIRTLTAEYESVYYIDLNTGKLTITKMSDDVQKHIGHKYINGVLYQHVLSRYLDNMVLNSDADYLRQFLDAEFIRSLLKDRDIFHHIYRVGTEEDFHYDEMKIVKANAEEEVNAVVIGIADRDDEVRQRLEIERLKAEREKVIEEARIAAEAANKAKSSFLFNMSHDIRTPMNAIIGFNSMALKHIDERSKVSDYLEKVGMSSQHLLSIINDVLDMARIESGKVTIEESAVSVTASSEDLGNIVEQTAKDKNINFTTDFSGISHDFVYADKLRVNRVMMNLISNAIKYTPDGGNVLFSVAETGCDGEHASFRFTVKDNGIGMSEDYLKHVFEAFTREASTVVNKIQGTGLGMAITKELTELMGGTISIDSELGKGTEVNVDFRFRLADSADTVSEDESEGDASALNGKLVLLADDNELNREIGAEVLTDFGMSVEEAADGTEAVDMFKKSVESGKRYDLILMDVQMPGMDGYEATETIRELEKSLNMHTPIIAMTANAFAEDKIESLRHGMDAHLSKPINIPELLKTLKGIL